MKQCILIVILASVLPALMAETGTEIMKAVTDNRSMKTSAMEIDMSLIDESGKTGTRKLQTLVSKSDGLVKTVTLFLEPASVKNTRFLTVENKGRDNDQWIYLPALKKVKRIAASERSGSFMGSDFSYADMGQLSGSIDEADHTLLGEEDHNGTPCYVIESTPGKTAPDYGKTVSWIEKEGMIVLKVDFYSKDKSSIVKTLVCENPETIDGYRIARKMTMTTRSNGHTTVIEITKTKYNMPVKAGYFTEYFLETGRTR